MKTCLVGGAVVLLTAGTALGQIEIVAFDSQPSPTSADGYFADGRAFQFYSQRIAGAFSPTEWCLSKGLTFWGSSENFSTPDLDNVLQFYVAILNDDAGNPGNPGQVLGEQTLFMNQFTVTATGRDNALGGHEYKFEIPDLGFRVPLTPGTQYWMNVGALLDQPQEDAWGWTFSNSQSWGVASNPWHNPGWQTVPNQFGVSFQLTGVPAPATLALAGAALLTARRRRSC